MVNNTTLFCLLFLMWMDPEQLVDCKSLLVSLNKAKRLVLGEVGGPFEGCQVGTTDRNEVARGNGRD